MLVVVAAVLLLIGIAVPSFNEGKDKAKEAQVKANLHNIQLSVERFAVVTEGVYPQFLIGGSSAYSKVVNLFDKDGPFKELRWTDPVEQVSDILLRRGYIDSYPRNPFIRDPRRVHKMQLEGLASFIEYGDRMRNGTEGYNSDEMALGTRFGPKCNLMGNVMAEMRNPQWMYVDPKTGGLGSRPTGCTEVYRCWDIWQGDEPNPYMPGAFFYKGHGPVIYDKNNDPTAAVRYGPLFPVEIDSYIMGVYGGAHSKGKDVIGDELPIQYGGREQWNWTRSEQPGFGGSPYTVVLDDNGEPWMQYGNPNGIRDSVVLLLTAGEDW